VKYNTAGDVVWTKKAGSEYSDAVYDIATDHIGNIFLTGFFEGPIIYFDEEQVASITEFSDPYLVSYTTDGEVRWASSGNGTGNYGFKAISTDLYNNLYLTGVLVDPIVTFDSINLTSRGNTDIFLIKYTHEGNVVWARSLGGNDRDTPVDIITSSNGDIDLTGYFSSPHVLCGNLIISNQGEEDILIVKFDSTGKEHWMKAAGGINIDCTYSISTDQSNNIFLGGIYYSPTIQFGPSLLENAGSCDIFILKYDQEGNEIWGKSAGGPYMDYLFHHSSDIHGAISITGFFEVSTKFGNIYLSGTGKTDMFISRLDGNTGVPDNKKFQQIKIFPNPLTESSTIVCLDPTIDFSITLVTISGVDILETLESHKGKVKLNRETLHAGIYIWTAKLTDGSSQTGKLIVQ
jgi:hypothetical protein